MRETDGMLYYFAAAATMFIFFLAATFNILLNPGFSQEQKKLIAKSAALTEWLTLVLIWAGVIFG